MDTAELRRTFSTRIRNMREGKLNQGEFADSVGISRGAMSYYEQEARTPDIGVLRAICVKYNISADYLLGIIPDPNHQVSNTCHETGLSPDAVKTLNQITRFINAGSSASEENLKEILNEEDVDLPYFAVTASLPEVLSALLENSEGHTILTMLGAIILGAEVDTGGHEILLRINSALKQFRIAYPIDDITPALWSSIQYDANILKMKLESEKE